MLDYLLLFLYHSIENSKGNVIAELSTDQIKELIASGTITGGMIPKTETALSAIEGGVLAVVILDGRAPNACLLELFTKKGAGTIIRPD